MSLFSSLLLIFSIHLFPADIREMQSKFNEIAAKASPAVVYISVEKEAEARVVEPEFFFGYVIPDEKVYKYKLGGAGSGVIVDERGYVITNYHVVEESDDIKVKVRKGDEEKIYSAYYAGGDSTLDIAVLKIKSEEKFPFLKFSEKTPLVGDIVFAIGYPFGYSQTFTQGVISGLRASLKVEGRSYRSLIQTDAAINQGNSGGPLMNIDCEIAGIDTAIMSPTGVFAGLGFAIPAAQAKEVFEQVVFNKKKEKAWLGVSLLPVKELISKGYNLYIPEGGIINRIFEDSPASRAGLRRGDVIVSADGADIKDDEDLYAAIYRKKPGEKISIDYVRDGKRKNISAVLAARPEEKALISRLSEKKSEVKEEFSWEGVSFASASGGLSVLSVSSKSPLRKYLKEGDLIKGVNGRRAASNDELKKDLLSSSLSAGVLFDLERDGEPFYLSVQVGK